eukprot:1137431-Pelagomonas_calceolata.AAC.5
MKCKGSLVGTTVGKTVTGSHLVWPLLARRPMVRIRVLRGQAWLLPLFVGLRGAAGTVEIAAVQGPQCRHCGSILRTRVCVYVCMSSK